MRRRFPSDNALIQYFKDGGTFGYTRSMSIEEDKLYSYSKCIAVRLRGGSFIVSNKSSTMGGGCHSMSTSQHIHKVYDKLDNVILVDGWASVDGVVVNYEKAQGTHKTVWGVVKAFSSWKSYSSHNSRYFDENNTLIINSTGFSDTQPAKLLLGSDNTILVEKYNIRNCAMKSINLTYPDVPYYKAYNKQDAYVHMGAFEYCVRCPRRFRCITGDTHYINSGSVYYLNPILHERDDLKDVLRYCKSFLNPHGWKEELRGTTDTI